MVYKIRFAPDYTTFLCLCLKEKFFFFSKKKIFFLKKKNISAFIDPPRIYFVRGVDELRNVFFEKHQFCIRFCRYF